MGIGYFLFGGEPEADPSQEVNQIIEGEPVNKNDNVEESDVEEEGEDGGAGGRRDHVVHGRGVLPRSSGNGVWVWMLEGVSCFALDDLGT